MTSDAAPHATPVNSGRAPNEATTMADSVRITIPSRSEYVRVVRLAVLGIASRMAFSYDDVEDIKLAVSEACNNAILHADAVPDSAVAQNAGPHSFITVTLTPWPDRLEISVADEGRVPPPGLAAPPSPSLQNVPDAELKESGLGLFLMEALMDAVEHQTGADSNTLVCMMKYTRHHFTSNENA
jgi:serine/threonine-protein kinase RsbW